MKLNISCPATGSQKLIEIDDEKKLRAVYDRRMAQEVDGGDLGDEFKGYIFKISGGNDKQGFPMKQGVLSQKRVRLLLTKGLSCYRPRRKGERKRKSVRGCIVGADLATLNLVVVKIGEQPIPGLTDVVVDKWLGPKRANNIRSLFNLSKEDDVRKYVVRRTFTNKAGKEVSKAPKIQRLITPQVLQRERRRKALRAKLQQAHIKEEIAYKKLFQQRMKEAKERRASEASKRRSRQRSKQESK
mmetsp:Transcript_16094/g.26282  ORF Transcript_16094/g.26282 Transcript_16094/m.26282 type:complete len:243 (+) Transcript_16094:76-804(+)